ncbi:hypothetical protein CI1B_22660 [Bradyrhizobium ivorense]|uniref:Uncharacterized protein n=1 Tax=Bradyrhizobium ivorense TaxID=2511166 RepID=A0A508T1D7_9BRAD|nr:hypothetical protein CI1B_22660 [Bradyrhizobium ivorense]
MLAGQDNEVDRAVARRIAPQLFDRLISDEEVECRHLWHGLSTMSGR